MELTIEELRLISKALSYAQNYLYNDMDAICDEDYREEAESVLECINNSISIVNNFLYNKQDSL